MREDSGRVAFLALQLRHLCWPLSMRYREAPETSCTPRPCSWDSAGHPARGAVCEPTRSEEGLETHLASGAALEMFLVSVRALSGSSHSRSVCLCVTSAFPGKKKKQQLIEKSATSSQPNGSMSLVTSSLQKEVSKPPLHFTQGYNETKESKGT